VRRRFSWLAVHRRAGLQHRHNAYVNAEPGYPQTTAVMNRFSELTIDVYGADTGRHARTAIGVATVPSQPARRHLGRSRDQPAEL
jgi:hypothetical protein